MLKQNPKIPEGINSSDENPLKEFFTLLLGIGLAAILVVVILSVMANWLAPYIPFSWEQKALTGTAFLNNTDEESPIHRNAEQALSELGERILEQANLPSELSFHFHLLEDDTPNAFASLGGHVFVTRGLLEAISSENALAMVVAHEIGHIQYRHPIQTLTRGALINIVYIALMGGGGSADAQNLLGQAGLITALSFNREMEFDADAFGVALVQKMYGHLEGADEFFKNMLKKDRQAEWLIFFETHPHTEERMEKILAARQDPLGKNPTWPLDARITSYLTQGDQISR